jgi:hypothetical protein
MKNKFGLMVATLGTALALLAPATAMARDRDDRGRDGHEYREHERHERWERAPRYNGNGFYSAPSYGYGYTAPADGYYDRYGNFHPYVRGYYDRRGHYHRY